MNKFVNCYYCFILSSALMCNFAYVNSEDPIPPNLNYRGKYTSDIKSYEIVIPQRVNKDGSFISHLVSHHHSKRSTKDLELIFYKIPIGGKEYLIELTPNRKLISPGAVVEIHKEDAGKSSKRKFLNESSKEENTLFDNLNIRKLENTECHFYGHVKGENISKAALSTCYGLAGFIQITNEFYTIEPVAEHNPFVEDAFPHILYKGDSLENSSLCHTMGELNASLNQGIRKRRESSFGFSNPTYIEILIVMDKTLISHHKDSDCENYVLTVFNMAFNLFHDASLGLMTTLTIVRIIRLEVENDEMNLRVNADAEKTLQYFQTWQYEINPGDDTHPNHHDVAVLITRVNVCYSPSSCGLLGLTTIGKACDPKLSAALCEDNGLRLGFVIAHEIGHLLGADHDLPNTTCNGTDANGLLTVMHPHVSLTAHRWSKCSQDYFKAFFDSGMGSCFLDEPEDHNFNIQDMLPGVMYNADFQCKRLITMNAQECEMGSTCQSLNCFIPGYACIVTHTPPADGTRCGENMWCHNTKCLILGERPGAVDGNWGEWSPWSDCSRTCGSGVASSERNCDKPQPAHGGKNCIGDRKRYKICAATKVKKITTDPHNISDLIRFISEEVNVSFVGKPCETGRPSFRDIQCGEFDDWIYPEDGKTHTWRAHYFHDDNPCILYCITESKQIAALRPRVVDGTMCYRGIRDICVGGACRSLPCDLCFQSNAVEDACGVCHGDGTSCEFSEGMETFTKLHKGLTKLVNVPAGTKNIKVEEVSPTLSRIMVRDKDTKDIYVKGKFLGMFNVPGSQAWLGMIKKNQEALHIPGPVSKPLSIWIQRLENVTVRWSMALPAEQQRKPEFTWDFLKWGPCSAVCGPGTQKSEPSCMEEKAGLVEDSFCADLEMPAAKVRPCEVTKCEPRWMVGDWKGCNQPGSTKKERKRVVYCIKKIGEGEGESQIVPDSECPPGKPHDSEPCENRQKREDSEYGIDDNYLDRTKYRSDTVEFGFHKKYDDYLTHFAALSVPQRKSETIPLHLLSSPHFKHYFRVLETPDYDTESASFSDIDINLPNSNMSYSQAQNKVSPDFYRNTFSGNQIDVSHIRSMASVARRNSGPVNSRNTPFNTLSLKPWTLQPEKYEIESSPRPTSNSGLEKKYERNEPVNKFFGFRKLQHKATQSKNPYDGKASYFFRNYPKLKGRKIRDRKSFNYISPNLSHYIENISGNDSVLKKRYLNLVSQLGKLSPYEKNTIRNLQWNAYNSKSYKLDNLQSRRSAKNQKFRHNLKELENTVDQNMLGYYRKLDTNEFDGSGIRKLNIDPDSFDSLVPFGENFAEVKKGNLQRWMARQGKFCSRPFKNFPRQDSISKRTNFRNRYVSLEDLFFDKRTKRFQSQNLPRKTPELTMETSHQRSKLINFRGKADRGRRKKKRSSHKWKKPKIKDTNSKEVSNFGCGTETRNYLNNLFRDNRPKSGTNKQEPKQKAEKPVIKAGLLVIDRDSADDQRVDILFQEDETEESTQKFTGLPRPCSRGKKISLKGQQVFNLMESLQERRSREAFYRGGVNNLNKNSETIEVNIKIPDICCGKNTTVSNNTNSSSTSLRYSYAKPENITLKPISSNNSEKPSTVQYTSPEKSTVKYTTLETISSADTPTESTSQKPTERAWQNATESSQQTEESSLKDTELTGITEVSSKNEPEFLNKCDEVVDKAVEEESSCNTTETNKDDQLDAKDGDECCDDDDDNEEEDEEKSETTTEPPKKKKKKKKRIKGKCQQESSIDNDKKQEEEKEDKKSEDGARFYREMGRFLRG